MDNSNLLLAVILSIAILVGFQYFYAKPQQERLHQQMVAEKLAKEVKP
jgi:YidC/Oxa1 family membrane protein insertase